MLGIAGPGGTLLAFGLVGLVSMFVMEGICEMIVLWPIPNAMVEFVRTFVDEDLAMAIGISYWQVFAGLVAFSDTWLTACLTGTHTLSPLVPLFSAQRIWQIIGLSHSCTRISFLLSHQ